MFNSHMRRDKAQTPGLEPNSSSMQQSSSGSSLLKRAPYTIKKMAAIHNSS